MAALASSIIFLALVLERTLEKETPTEGVRNVRGAILFTLMLIVVIYAVLGR